MNTANFTAGTGQQQFLQLLVTQLQYQNPLEPVEQQDFLGQLAQFSTLEGIEQLNLRFSDMLRLQELTEGASLVGRTVRYTDPATDTPRTGVVSEARIGGDQMVLVIDGNEITLDQVTSVVAESA